MSADRTPAPRDARAAADDIDLLCFHNLMNTPGGIFFFKDVEGRFLRVSHDCAKLTGRSQSETIGLTDRDLTDPTHAAELHADEQRVMVTGEPLLDKEEANRLVNQPGTWVETSKFPLRDSAGTVIGTFGWSRDVTRWEEAEAALARAAADMAASHAELAAVEEQLRQVLHGTPDAIVRYDPGLRYLFVNSQAERLRGLSMAQVIGRTDRELGLDDLVLAPYEAILRDVASSGVAHEVELPVGALTGIEGQWFHISVTPEKDTSGEVTALLVSGRDITRLKHAERSATRRALHDPLTGLANRHLLLDRLSAALVRLERNGGQVTVLFVDLDGFKQINDDRGHAVGDVVLAEAARRLERAARRSDTVARLGGDEFVVVCELAHDEDPIAIVERMTAILQEPFEPTGDQRGIAASIGTASSQDPNAHPADLLAAADQAMYRAKRARRPRG